MYTCMLWIVGSIVIMKDLLLKQSTIHNNDKFCSLEPQVSQQFRPYPQMQYISHPWLRNLPSGLALQNCPTVSDFLCQNTLMHRCKLTDHRFVSTLAYWCLLTDASNSFKVPRHQPLWVYNSVCKRASRWSRIAEEVARRLTSSLPDRIASKTAITLPEASELKYQYLMEDLW